MSACVCETGWNGCWVVWRVTCLVLCVFVFAMCVRVCDCAALMSQKRLSDAEASSKAAAAAVVSVDRM